VLAQEQVAHDLARGKPVDPDIVVRVGHRLDTALRNLAVLARGAAR
jgi:hypothetical protein